MPTPAYISIEGETQGLLTQGANSEESVGNIWVQGHEDEVLVQELNHVVTIPRDPQSGQPSGQRVHKPLSFTCVLNKAVPLMYNSLVTGEILPNVELKWYRTDTAAQTHFFTTKLEDAVITNIHCELPHCQDPDNEDYTQKIKVELSYRKVTWTHETAATSAADDWRAPIEA